MKNDEFCVLMRSLRERSEISARALSIQAGLSPSYVSKVESGSVLPTIESFARLIEHLTVTDREIVFLLKTLTNKGSKQ